MLKELKTEFRQKKKRGSFMKKRICAVVLAGIMISGMSVPQVFAADYKDEPYSGYVNYQSSVVTRERQKGERSSVYVWNTEGPSTNLAIQIEAKIGGVWQNKTMKSGINQSGGTAYIPSGPATSTKRRVRSAAYEANNGPVGVRLRFPTQSARVVGGQWSPDCKGNYTVANP